MRKIVLIISVISVLNLSFTSCYPTSPTNTSPEEVSTETRERVVNPEYVYEEGAIHVGGDGKPIELIDNPDASNPTYAELVRFLKEDVTDEKQYIDDSSILAYVCSDFAEDVHNNAEAIGIRAAWVSIEFAGEEIGHALNAFNTIDRGLIYADCTGGSVGGIERLKELNKDSSSTVTSEQTASWDNIAYIEVGKEYGLIYIDVVKSFSYSFYEEYKRKWQEYDVLVSAFNEDADEYAKEIEEKGLLEGSAEFLRIEAWEERIDEQEQVLDKLDEEYNNLSRDYDNEVERYNQEIEGKVYYEGSQEMADIEAWEEELEEKEKILDELAEEYNRLSNDYNNDVKNYNKELATMGMLEGSPEALRLEAWETRLEKQEQMLNELDKELGEFWAEPLGIVSKLEIFW
jgi:uncharacterized coiled-coil protein SlyX